MEIKKLLRIKTMGVTPTEPNGCLLSDVGTEYPVLLDSLTNTIIFPQLQESGYKLIALPHVFEKDGVATNTLPVEDYTPTPDEEQAMYNMVGTPFNNGNLSAFVTEATVDISNMPKTKVTINTREEFLQYLRHIHSIKEPLPIPFGYFVSQNALFTFEEYISDENRFYRDIIENRHNISYKTYLALCVFFMDMGLADDATYLDVLKVYMSWGIDGVRYSIITSSEQRNYKNIYREYIKSPNYAFTTSPGFIDARQTKYVSDNPEDNTWHINELSKESTMRKLLPDENGNIALPADELLYTEYEKNVVEMCVRVQCSGYTYAFDTDSLLLNDSILSTVLNVVSDFDKITIPSDCLGMGKKEIDNYYEWQYLISIARMMTNKRIKKCNATSFKTLMLFNYTPVAAMRYIAHKLGYTEDSIQEQVLGDGDEPIILPDDIYQHYCDEDWDEYKKVYGDQAEAYEEILDDIVNGNLNCDNLAEGISDESAYNVLKLYNQLYAVHHVMKVPLSDIHQKISDAKIGDNIVFTMNGLKYTLSMSAIKFHYNAYSNDLQKYAEMAAKSSTILIEVRKILREVGAGTTKRHVGAVVLEMEKTPAVNEILTKIKLAYTEHIEMNIVNKVERNKYYESLNTLACKGIFELYHTKQIKFPERLGGGVFELTPDMLSSISEATKLRVDSIQAFSLYCQKATSIARKTTKIGAMEIVTESVNEYGFAVFVTNAIMAQDRIIPRTGFTIPEISFFAVWKDYSTIPNIRSQLVSRGIITDRHVAYAINYHNLSFLDFTRDSSIEKYSLKQYAKQAVTDMKAYKEDKSVTYEAVTHQLEYLYPRVYSKEPYMFTENLDDYPYYPLGLIREITIKDYWDDIQCNVNDDIQHGIKYFNGFNADVFKLRMNPVSLIPDQGTKRLDRSGNYLIAIDEKKAYDYTRVKELEDAGYPVKHVMDNVYLVRLHNDLLLEVSV